MRKEGMRERGERKISIDRGRRRKEEATNVTGNDQSGILTMRDWVPKAVTCATHILTCVYW